MSAIESTLTRWREIVNGDLLVAVAVKEDDGRMVLPVYAGRVPDPLDWMPEAAFLQVFEQVAS